MKNKSCNENTIILSYFALGHKQWHFRIAVSTAHGKIWIGVEELKSPEMSQDSSG